MNKIINQLAEELNIKKTQVESTIELIDDGNTIPFIARYRKEVTGGLSDEILREFDKKLTYLRNLESRKDEVINIIQEQGKLTQELKDKIVQATVLQKVEDLYRPFKQKRQTRATKAKKKGLEPLAQIILDQSIEDQSLESIATPYLSEEVTTVEEAYDGAKDIIAEIVSDAPETREYLRNRYIREGKMISSVKDESLDEKGVFEMYYEYQEPVKSIANHRVLALDRGEKEKILSVKVDVNEVKNIGYLKIQYIRNESAVTHSYLVEAIEDGYKRLLAPSLEREVRRLLTDRAQEEAINVFAKNTEPLLMQAPVENVRVLAIDPSYRTGCKIAILNETGKLLDYTTIYPNPPQNQVEKSKKILKDLIKKYDINIIPIGNGTASRETEQLVAQVINEVDETVYYTIVSEAGASVYSASALATKEYPDVNVSIRGAISIGKRLQDPLAELVKIDPKSIGVGQYQHDLNQKELSHALNGVVENCVNRVGVDLNTASGSLLEYISGVSSSVAKNILSYRDEAGTFSSRSELKKVKRLGPKTYEQCAGFLRIKNGKNPLDNTSVHPESYKIAKKLVKKLGYSVKDISKNDLGDIEDRVKQVANNTSLQESIDRLAKELSCGVPTLEDIIKELKKPGRDPRDEQMQPVFKSDVLKMEDLEKDMVLKGTVRNVIDFGAFVDIGVKQDGLVHISQLSDQFVKDPSTIVSVGDVVTVKILDVDLKKGRISLTMKGL